MHRSRPASAFNSVIAAAVFSLLLFTGVAVAQKSSTSKASTPKIRTVTAFVRLDRAAYRREIDDALTMLHAAKQQFATAGYEVETLRITTQPFPEIVRGLSATEAVNFFRELDKLAEQEGFTPNIGPAMVRDDDDLRNAELLAQIITQTSSVNSYIAVADESGVHWRAIRAAAKTIKYLEEHTPHGEGNFRFAAAAFPPPNAPFYPVSSTQGAGHGFAIGIESAGIVNQVFSAAEGDIAAGGEHLTAELGIEAQKVEAIARTIEKASGWSYFGIDLTPVPLKDISIGGAMESLLRSPLGSPGSLSVSYAITSAVRRIPVKQTGYSGLMLPVLEDSSLARRWESGTVTRDALLAYSAVCSAGLDAIPLPGDVSEQELENIIADVASLAVKWKKPLSARLLPAPGKRTGDMTEFSSPYLVNIHIR